MHVDDDQVTYLDPTGEDEHNAISMYSQDIPSYQEHNTSGGGGGIVILENEAHNSLPPSLKRHVVMTREQQDGGTDLTISHQSILEKRSTTRLPFIQSTEFTRSEGMWYHILY